MCTADKDLLDGKEARLSLLMFKSEANTRATASTMLSEANAMSFALADAEWLASWLGMATNLDYDLRKRDILNRRIQIRSIMSDTSTDHLKSAVVTDAMSLYDNLLQQNFTNADKRSALEVCVIRDSLEAVSYTHLTLPTICSV